MGFCERCDETGGHDEGCQFYQREKIDYIKDITEKVMKNSEILEVAKFLHERIGRATPSTGGATNVYRGPNKKYNNKRMVTVFIEAIELLDFLKEKKYKKCLNV